MAYWLAARRYADLRLPRNFALLLLTSCIVSNLTTWVLPYPEGIKLFAGLDLGCLIVTLCVRPRYWVRLLTFAFLAMLILHGALWGPHLPAGGLPSQDQLRRYFVILDVMYVLSLLIVALPGGRLAIHRLRAGLSDARRLAYEPVARR